MSTWAFSVDFDWPEQGTDLEGILAELLDTLNRENIVWYDASVTLKRDSDGSY